MIIPFQISIGGRGPGGGYSLRAAAAGREAEASLDLPSLPDDPAALGAALGRAIFGPALRRLLLDVASGADEAGARLQIQLRVAPPELAALPWEWMSLGATNLWRPATRDDYALVRVGQAARPLPALGVVAPLRLLIAAAPGADSAADALGAALAPLVRARRLVVDRLRDADPLALAEALAEEPCHMLHVIAPVSSGPAMSAPRGPAPRLRLGRAIDAGALAGILAAQPDLRLLTLADAGGAAPEALSALAAALHEAGGLATLALGALGAGGAAQFCAACYAALAVGEPADLAVTAGRAGLAESDGAWGEPQLHLAPGGESLFELVVAPARGAAPAPADPPPPRAGRRDRPPRRPARRTGVSWADGALQLFQPLARPQPRPALPARGEPAAPQRRLRPRLVALIVASIILALMVSRSLRWPADAGAAAPTAPADPTAPLPSPAPPTLPPVPPAGPPGAAAPAPPGNPLSAPQPTGYATYLAAEGDSPAAIAERAGSDPQALLALNRLTAGEPLRPGRPLVLPLYRGAAALPAVPPVVRGSPARPQVALTFDIEIDDGTLYSILDILGQRGLKGTFFVTGYWVKAYPDAARRIVAEGHEVGNHSLTHPAFSKIGLDGVLPELDQTEQIIRETLGVSSRPYFRFPYGDSTPAAVDLIARDGYVAYHWSADDAAIPSWIARVAADPTQAYGGILLMHGRPSTVAALPGWIDQLLALGLQPVTLGQVLS